jgi:hypothetical protein
VWYDPGGGCGKKSTLTGTLGLPGMSTLGFKVFLHVEEMLQDGCPDRAYSE